MIPNFCQLDLIYFVKKKYSMKFFLARVCPYKHVITSTVAPMQKYTNTQQQVEQQFFGYAYLCILKNLKQ